MKPSPPASSPSVPLHPGGRRRWIICALLFFATTVNYVDRQILSLLKPMLDEQMGWTNTEFGMINSAFQAAYGVSLLGFGWLVDRVGTKVGYAVSIGLWSLAALGHSLVGSVGGFLGARVALGLGEGGNFPAAIKATAQWFPKRERAFATSLFNSGANVGAIAAPAFVPLVAYALGWHWAFVMAGVAGFVWLALWLAMFELPRRSRKLSPEELAWIEADAEETQEKALPWKSALRRKEAWSFIAAKFLTDPVWWFFLIWLPDFFKKTRGLDIKNSWTLLVAIYAIITVLSVFGGWITGYLQGRGWSVTKSRKIGLLAFALCVTPLAIVTRVGDWTAVLLIGLAGAAHQAWSANLFTTVSDMFPRRAVGSLTGIGGTAGSVGGMLVPLAVGMALDRYPDGYSAIFAVFSMTYVAAFVVNHLLAPSFQPLKGLEE